MADNTLLNLAKQGKPGAIAAMLNRSFQKEGWTCKGRTNGNELKLTFEGENPPQLEQIRDRLMRGLQTIQPDGIAVVVLDARKSGQSKPLWSEVISLNSDHVVTEEKTSSEKSITSPRKSVISQAIQPKSQVLSVPEKQSLVQKTWSELNRLSGTINLFLLTGVIILLFFIFEDQKKARTVIHQWEYKIESFEDYEFSEINNMGVDGWELVVARRALTGDTDDRRGVYECIFKRPLKGTAKER